MRELSVSMTYGEVVERRVSREQLNRDSHAGAAVLADRLRRRENLLHSLEVARRRRKRRLTTRFTWDPAASWDDLT